VNTETMDRMETPINQEDASTGASISGLVNAMLAAAEEGRMSDIYRRVVFETERELFAQAITRARGNQSKAARWLGISRVTMLDRLREHGLHSRSQQEEDSKANISLTADAVCDPVAH
jgi:DNA-binding protein Fis